MARHIALDKAEVVCGKPLPFSIVDPGRNLLLASKGQVVTERMREALLRNGLMAIADDGDAHSSREQPGQDALSPLLQLRQQYARASAISRSGFRISRDERSECFSCHVIGMAERRRAASFKNWMDSRRYSPAELARLLQSAQQRLTRQLAQLVARQAIHDPKRSRQKSGIHTGSQSLEHFLRTELGHDQRCNATHCFQSHIFGLKDDGIAHTFNG